MSDFIPVNDLDRAIMAVRKSKAALPDFYRRLSEGELWFSVQYHPEVEEGGSFSIENGSPVPFAMLDDGKGHTLVPLFSSDARFDESLKRSNMPEESSSGIHPNGASRLNLTSILRVFAPVGGFSVILPLEWGHTTRRVRSVRSPGRSHDPSGAVSYVSRAGT